MVVELMLDAARRQQDLAFAMAWTACSAMHGGGQAGQFFSQATAAYGRACTRGFDAMRAISGTAFEAARAGRAPQA